MATIRKHRNKWQVMIRLRGIKPISKSFERKSDATRWARAIEGEIAIGKYTDPRKAELATIAQIIDRYLTMLDDQGAKDNARRSRLKRLRRDLGAFSLAKLSTQKLAEYRDLRLQVVSATTVSHELSLLRRLLNIASTEWGITLPNGIPRIPNPQLPHGRTRRLSPGEEGRLLSSCKDDPKLQSLIELALETAMRRGELVNIQSSDINWKKSTLTIPKTKSGVPRVVPLSPRALSILESQNVEKERVIDLTATRASQKFAAACKKAGIVDFRLHDLRHEAISRLVELGLGTLEVAAISGHKTVSMLARYSHPNPALLAVKLANRCP
jgi:integrase